MFTVILTLKELVLKVALDYDGSNRCRSSNGTKQTSNTSMVPIGISACKKETDIMMFYLCN